MPKYGDVRVVHDHYRNAERVTARCEQCSWRFAGTQGGAAAAAAKHVKAEPAHMVTTFRTQSKTTTLRYYNAETMRWDWAGA